MRAAVIVGLFLAGAASHAAEPEVPESIRAPAGEHVVVQAHASGSQIDVCGAGADGKPAWTLKAPEAELKDDRGAVVGRHFAGPTWKYKDGSEVAGKLVAKANSPDPASIPWLLLTATGHNGTGMLANVTTIQRVNTKGGQPPSDTCDATKLNSEVWRPYTADYYFYAAK
jgi:hypothetical protein